MQSRWPVRAFGLCRGKMQQALGSLAYCLPHSALKSPPPHPLTPPARSGCLSVPFRLLAGALVAYLYSCLLFSGCLPASPPPPPAYLMAAYLVFPAACRAVRLLAGTLRLLAFLLGCLPGLEAAFLLCGLLALPPGHPGHPVLHLLIVCVYLSACRVSCVVVFVPLFICCQLLPHPHVGLALRLVRMNLFLGRHPLLSEDFAFFLCRS